MAKGTNWKDSKKRVQKSKKSGLGKVLYYCNMNVKKHHRIQVKKREDTLKNRDCVKIQLFNMIN